MAAGLSCQGGHGGICSAQRNENTGGVVLMEEMERKPLEDRELEAVTGGAGSQSGYVKTTGTYVNVRNAAGNGEKIGCVDKKGTVLPFYGWYNGWAKVEYKGNTGYIWHELVVKV